MKKFFCFTSVAVLALFLSSSSLELLAQGKKSGKQSTIELIESKDGKFRFSIRDGEGKYLAGSPVGHATEKEAREAVEQLKQALLTAKYVSKKSDSDKGSESAKEKPPGK